MPRYRENHVIFMSINFKKKTCSNINELLIN